MNANRNSEPKLFGERKLDLPYSGDTADCFCFLLFPLCYCCDYFDFECCCLVGIAGQEQKSENSKDQLTLSLDLDVPFLTESLLVPEGIVFYLD